MDEEWRDVYQAASLHCDSSEIGQIYSISLSFSAGLNPLVYLVSELTTHHLVFFPFPLSLHSSTRVPRDHLSNELLCNKSLPPGLL